VRCCGSRSSRVAASRPAASDSAVIGSCGTGAGGGLNGRKVERMCDGN